MAVEIPHFHDFPVFRKPVAFGNANGAHESFPSTVQGVDGDGAVALCGLLVRLGADDERCGRHELALEMLAGAPARVDGVPVLANESFGANFVQNGSTM